MTRVYSFKNASRITQPIRLARRRPTPHVDLLRFTCFRLVPTGDGLVAIEMHHAATRMFAFVTA
jgi:hypothetical protein